LIESRGFYVSEKEVHSLVEKIDKDKDGRITYSEVSFTFPLREGGLLMFP
jgi:Ca2+-binding EF-hand superfamily protein